MQTFEVFRRLSLLVAVLVSLQLAVSAREPDACGASTMDTIPTDPAKKAEVEKIIREAISLGAPIYNEGMHMACYRIYEWAAYKILYVYGKDCPEVEKTLKAAVERSHGDMSDTEKAWLMRMAFDKVLGEPTRTTAPGNEDNRRKG